MTSPKNKHTDIRPLPSGTSLSWSPPKVPKGRKIDLKLSALNEMIALQKQKGNLLSDQSIEDTLKTDLLFIESDPVFQKIPDYRFSNYSMEPSAIDFLKRVVENYKPACILELGSGLSTAILSYHQQQALKGSGVKPRYVTIDQSSDYLKDTEAMVRSAVPDSHVKFVQMDVVQFDVHGNKDYSCYSLDEDKLHKACGGIRPDMIIVDGPVGGGQHGVPYARFLTLPIVQNYAASGALAFLDDGLRHTELEIAAQWHQIKTLHVYGIQQVSKGITVVQIRT